MEISTIVFCFVHVNVMYVPGQCELRPLCFVYENVQLSFH